MIFAIDFDEISVPLFRQTKRKQALLESNLERDKFDGDGNVKFERVSLCGWPSCYFQNLPCLKKLKFKSAVPVMAL